MIWWVDVTQVVELLLLVHQQFRGGRSTNHCDYCLNSVCNGRLTKQCIFVIEYTALVSLCNVQSNWMTHTWTLHSSGAVPLLTLSSDTLGESIQYPCSSFCAQMLQFHIRLFYQTFNSFLICVSCHIGLKPAISVDKVPFYLISYILSQTYAQVTPYMEWRSLPLWMCSTKTATTYLNKWFIMNECPLACWTHPPTHSRTYPYINSLCKVTFQQATWSVHSLYIHNFHPQSFLLWQLRYGSIHGWAVCISYN